MLRSNRAIVKSHIPGWSDPWERPLAAPLTVASQSVVAGANTILNVSGRGTVRWLDFTGGGAAGPAINQMTVTVDGTAVSLPASAWPISVTMQAQQFGGSANVGTFRRFELGIVFHSSCVISLNATSGGTALTAYELYPDFPEYSPWKLRDWELFKFQPFVQQFSPRGLAAASVSLTAVAGGTTTILNVSGRGMALPGLAGILIPGSPTGSGGWYATIVADGNEVARPGFTSLAQGAQQSMYLGQKNVWFNSSLQVTVTYQQNTLGVATNLVAGLYYYIL